MAARKAQVAPSKQILKERRSKAATDSNAGVVSRKRGGSFMKRGVLRAKKLSSALIRPTTAGLAPSGKSAAEKEVESIEAAVRAKAAAAEKEEEEREK